MLRAQHRARARCLAGGGRGLEPARSGRRKTLDTENRAEQQKLREIHGGKRVKPVHPLAAARAAGPEIDFREPPTPSSSAVACSTTSRSPRSCRTSTGRSSSPRGGSRGATRGSSSTPRTARPPAKPRQRPPDAAAHGRRRPRHRACGVRVLAGRARRRRHRRVRRAPRGGAAAVPDAAAAAAHR